MRKITTKEISVYKVRLLQKFVVSSFTTFPIRLLKELLKIILMVKGLQQMAKLEKNRCHHVLHTKKHYRKNIVVKRTRKDQVSKPKISAPKASNLNKLLEQNGHIIINTICI